MAIPGKMGAGATGAGATIGTPAGQRDGRPLAFAVGEPPPDPEPRYASLVTLAGNPITPQGEDEIEGAGDSGLGDLGGHPAVQTIRSLGIAEGELTKITAILPELLPMVQEFVLMMRTLVPKAAMARISGQMPGPGGAGMGPGMGMGMGMGAEEAPGSEATGMNTGMGMGMGMQPGVPRGVPMMPMLAGGMQ